MKLAALAVLAAPAALIALLVLPGPARGEATWSTHARLAGGLDSNVLRAPKGVESSGLLRVDGGARLSGERLELRLDGSHEQTTKDSALSESELEAAASYDHEVSDRLTFTLAALAAYRRDLTVYSDGTVLAAGGTLRRELGAHVLGVAVVELDPFDLELGARGDLETVSGNEKYDLTGAEFSIGTRWFATPWLTARARYAFTTRSLDGLTARNRAGGNAGIERAIRLSVHTGRLQLRAEPSERVALLVRYDHALVADDFTGYFDGTERELRAGGLVHVSPKVDVESTFGYLARTYGDRVASVDNQSSDATLGLTTDLELWLFRTVGLFARYQLERASAEPVGVLYTRHVVLAGVTGRLGER